MELVNLCRIKIYCDWYYGFPVSEIRDDNTVTFTAPKKLNNGNDAYDIYADASTLGRFTGIKDNNDKMIFTGDIVEIYCQRIIGGQCRSKHDIPTKVRAVVEYKTDWYGIGFSLNYYNKYNDNLCNPIGKEEDKRSFGYRPISHFDFNYMKKETNQKLLWRNYIKVIGNVIDNPKLLEVKNEL